MIRTWLADAGLVLVGTLVVRLEEVDQHVVAQPLGGDRHHRTRAGVRPILIALSQTSGAFRILHRSSSQAYLEWTSDPDPNDAWTVTEDAFLLSDREGFVSLVHEQHRTGLFSRGLWLRLLADAGFDPSAVTEDTTEERTPRDVFVGKRPLA